MFEAHTIVEEAKARDERQAQRLVDACDFTEHYQKMVTEGVIDTLDGPDKDSLDIKKSEEMIAMAMEYAEKYTFNRGDWPENAPLEYYTDSTGKEFSRGGAPILNAPQSFITDSIFGSLEKALKFKGKIKKLMADMEVLEKKFRSKHQENYPDNSSYEPKFRDLSGARTKLDRVICIFPKSPPTQKELDKVAKRNEEFEKRKRRKENGPLIDGIDHDLRILRNWEDNVYPRKVEKMKRAITNAERRIKNLESQEKQTRKIRKEIDREKVIIEGYEADIEVQEDKSKKRIKAIKDLEKQREDLLK